MKGPDLPPPPALGHLGDAGPIALFLDFDGTLIDIAPTPDSIEVPPDLAFRLAALAQRLSGRVALISGRGLDDVERHLGPLHLARAGSHGSDVRGADGQPIGSVPGALSASVLEEVAAFASARGFDLEDKPHGAALHYRARPALEPAGLAFAAELAGQHGLQVKRGKCVIELVSCGVDKAAAVHALMQVPPFADSCPVFVGDDVTDEDGMRAAVELGGFGIAVGDRISKNARYALADPAAVQHWLAL